MNVDEVGGVVGVAAQVDGDARELETGWLAWPIWEVYGRTHGIQELLVISGHGGCVISWGDGGCNEDV